MNANKIIPAFPETVILKQSRIYPMKKIVTSPLSARNGKIFKSQYCLY